MLLKFEVMMNGNGKWECGPTKQFCKIKGTIKKLKTMIVVTSEKRMDDFCCQLGSIFVRIL